MDNDIIKITQGKKYNVVYADPAWQYARNCMEIKQKVVVKEKTDLELLSGFILQ